MKAGSDRKHVLNELKFGDRVAENEAALLRRYFVETDQWKRVKSGEVDVVYGAKGSGKSAIYALLEDNASELFDRSIIYVAAENPRGTTAFQDLITDPPTSETEFVRLWKLYFLSLLGKTFDEYGISNKRCDEIVHTLRDQGLLEKRFSLGQLFSAAAKYVRRFAKPKSVEVAATQSEKTGTGFTVKIAFEEGDETGTGLVFIRGSSR
jgi:hypothetical protein